MTTSAQAKHQDSPREFLALVRHALFDIVSSAICIIGMSPVDFEGPSSSSFHTASFVVFNNPLAPSRVRVRLLTASGTAQACSPTHQASQSCQVLFFHPQTLRQFSSNFYWVFIRKILELKASNPSLTSVHSSSCAPLRSPSALPLLTTVYGPHRIFECKTVSGMLSVATSAVSYDFVQSSSTTNLEPGYSTSRPSCPPASPAEQAHTTSPLSHQFTQALIQAKLKRAIALLTSYILGLNDTEQK
ncbi:hypothetical protein B0H11DRAFT_1915296 [Mycena galericulata]|nr:hypothetical protein B0H11DRAFT_1915296 [Mycena galericulata]